MSLYLGVSVVVVSSVLISNEGGAPTPIYYVSVVVLPRERRYLPIEKLVLALVVTARKLCLYFQAHPIKVLMDQSLK